MVFSRSDCFGLNGLDLVENLRFNVGDERASVIIVHGRTSRDVLPSMTRGDISR